MRVEENIEILIAEDSPTQTVKLQHLLESSGYHVRAAPNGAKALELAKEKTPTLVITDIDMPQMNGYEFCRNLKNDDKLHSVPIILLTSLTDPSDVVRGLESGADYYLTKPYQPQDLLERVRETLNNPPPNGRVKEPPITFFVNNEPHVLTADRRQVLGLLLSIYRDAVQRNTALINSERELTQVNEELNRQNALLDQSVKSERRAYDELKKTQGQLIQAEKMVGLGQLVAGIAHEINNPLSFIINNSAVMQRDLVALIQLLDLYQRLDALAAEKPELFEALQAFSKVNDLPYIKQNLPDLLARSREGMNRILQIVTNLRDFVRLDTADFNEVDINAGIRSTIAIIRHKAEAKKIRIELDLQDLPPVSCYPAKVNQVIMNLTANAIDASPENSVITVRSRPNGDGVKVEVIDQGSGIPPEIRGEIFNPFFTTKPPGKGTGLGLSISFGIIRDHGGRIDVESEVGKGSRFMVHLPVHPSPRTENN